MDAPGAHNHIISQPTMQRPSSLSAVQTTSKKWSLANVVALPSSAALSESWLASLPPTAAISKYVAAVGRAGLDDGQAHAGVSD